MFEEIESELKRSIETAKLKRTLYKLKIISYSVGFFLTIVFATLTFFKNKHFDRIFENIFFTLFTIFFFPFILSTLVGLIPFQNYTYSIKRRFLYYVLILLFSVLFIFFFISTFFVFKRLNNPI